MCVVIEPSGLMTEEVQNVQVYFLKLRHLYLFVGLNCSRVTQESEHLFVQDVAKVLDGAMS